jgi:glucose/mannose transport system substrate-binding protein
LGSVLALTAAGCGSSAEAPSGPKLLTIAGSDPSTTHDAALIALLDVVRKQVPGIEITFQAQGTEPPDVFLIGGGSDLREWVARGRVAALDELAQSERWQTVFHDTTLAMFTGRDGHLYGVPLVLGRDNTMFFNGDVLGAAGVAPPKTVTDWFAAADALRALGKTPLEVSAVGGWTVASHLFEALVVAEAGPSFYYDYLAGGKTGDAPEIEQALVDLGKMMDYANADRASLAWGPAVEKVCTGEAPMIFLPDFAQGELKQQGCAPGRVGYVAFEPSTTPSFVYTSVGWAMTTDAPHRDMGIEFLKAVASKQGQEGYVPARGGIPARTDIDPTKFDAMTAQSVADLASSTTIKAPAYGQLSSTLFQEAINPVLQQFVDPASPDYQNVPTALAALKNNYGLVRP